GPGNDTFTGAPGRDSVNRGTPNLTAVMSALEAQIVALTNQQRAAAGLAPLAAEGHLTWAAQQHSTDMASLSAVLGLDGAMQHTLAGAPQPTLTSRADFAGYDYSALGENIAYGFTGAADVMQAWMNSAGHRANILSPLFSQVGVGVRANAQGVLYFTHDV